MIPDDNDLRKYIEAMERRYDFQIEGLNQRLAQLAQEIEEGQPLKLEGGHFLASFDKLECQLFHNTDLTAKEVKSGKTEYAAKLTFYKGSRRAHKAVALLAQDKFRHSVRAQTYEPILEMANAMKPNMVAGMNRGKPIGGGTPYIPEEYLLVADILTAPVVVVAMGNDMHRIHAFRPGKGNAKRKALWYGAI